MFTVKATYRGQTRKITFPSSNTFPTFEQLCNQLYRVFPISHNYYMSKLLFSPDSTNAGRILLAKEVHSADEYVQCLAQLSAGSWQNALLRFSVYEETPHKAPAVSTSGSTWSAYSASSSTLMDQSANSPFSTIVSNSIGFLDIPAISPAPAPAPIPPPLTLPFFVPPPPIIYSSPPRALVQAPMDIDARPSPASSCRTPEPHYQHPPPLPPPPPPCTCVKGKEQIQGLLTTFQTDLQAILTETFGAHPVAAHSAEHTSANSTPLSDHTAHPFAPPPQSMSNNSNSWSCLSHWCDTCMKQFDGPWFACSKCPSIQCTVCQSSFPNSQLVCLRSHDNFHSFNRRTCSVCTDSYPPGFIPGHLAPVPPAPFFCPQPQPPQPRTYSDPCQMIYTPAPPSVSVFVPPTPSVASPRPAPDAPSLPCVSPPETTPQDQRTDQLARTPPPPPPVIHRGILCDSCNSTVEGTRHKCLDCPDYDLCTVCIVSGGAERHNPFHEFFEIEEPGRVVVHTVFSGEGERPPPQAAPQVQSASSQGTNSSEAPQLPVHQANCDLCDSRIRGSRYKCLNCPDFDVCTNCYRIVDDHHPHHPFVSISDPKDFIRRTPSNTQVPRHYATCDACHKGINGVRYKCMHASCPDFDLCQNCEALPIPVHPSNHPMLKIRSPETVIPRVLRAGEPMRTLPPLPPLPPLPVDRSCVLEPPEMLQSAVPLAYRVGYSSPVAYSPPQSPCSIPGGFDSPRAASVIISSPIPHPIQPSSPLFNPVTFNPEVQEGPNANSSHLSLALFPALEPIQRPASEISNNKSQPASIHATPFHSPQAFPLNLETRQSSPSPSPDNFVEETRDAAVPDVFSQGPSGHQTPQSYTSTASRAPESSLNFKLPPLSIDNGSDIFRELWPRVAQEFSHLLNLQSQGSSNEHAVDHLTPGTTFDRGLFSESPLTGEPLLSRPLPVNVPEPQTTSSSIQSANALSSLAALLNANVPSIQIPIPSAPFHNPSEDVRTPSPSPVVKLPGSNAGLPDTLEVAPTVVETVENDEAQLPSPPVMSPVPQRISPKPRALNATFIADVTVPEGQVFPPGAEFVKSWKMLNDSEQAWPKATELVFVAGETMSRFPFVPVPVLVGSVAANSAVELSTGELKAPESPGRYVSYWRLRDESGELFGDSIWIDITVQESSSLTTSENVSPASSIIVPSKAQSTGSISHTGLPVDNASSVSPSVSPPPSTLRSFPIDEDAISEVESIASSVSLMSVPSSPSSDGFDNLDEDDDDDEAVVWEDSRSHFSNERPAATMENIEYVMLYDENSEEDI